MRDKFSQETLDKLADHLHVERKDATRLGYINKRPLTWSNEPRAISYSI